MNTEAPHAERDRPARPSGADERSRSARSTAGPEEPEPEPEEGAPPARRGWRRAADWWRGLGLWQETLVLAGVCFTLLCLVNAFLVQPFLIPSGSMENTLKIGDRVLVDKLAYRFGGRPQRGDVIVFDGTGSFVQDPPPRNPVTHLAQRLGGLLGLARPDGTDYIKRVIGVGGDRVTCCDAQGRILVNGHPVDEDFRYPGDAPSQVPFDIVVPPGRLWVMGDHRAASRDSRDHLGDPGGGTVPVDKVIGRADWIVWPLGRLRTLHRPASLVARR